MAKEFNLQEVLMGANFFFIEEGTLIGGGATPVSKLAIPADDNLTDFQPLGCAFNLKPYVTKEADTPRICFDGNKYTTITRDIVTGDGWEFDIHAHIEPVWRMILGLSSPIEDGVPVPLYETNIRTVTGYLKAQARNVLSRSDLFVFDMWCEMTVIGDPTYADKTVFPRLRFQKLESPNNVTQLSNVADLPVA